MKRLILLVLAPLVFVASAEARSYQVPVVRSVEVSDRITVPREVCRDQRSERRYNDNRRDSGTTGAIVGALVGGALGNQVGKGDGRTAATVGGAVVGGLVGRNVDRNDGSYRNRGRYERVCYTENTWETRRAWDVTYQVRGRYITERFDYNPGRYVRINR